MPAYDSNFSALPALAAASPAAASPAVISPAAAGPAASIHAAQAQAQAESGESVFSELLDIINPLQHLPVIGTLYRAVTGEHLDSFARVAGDALYGGLWGAVGAAADVVFEAVTGKSAEDTVLAWFDSSGQADGAGTGDVAATDPPRVTGETAQRALYAYRRGTALTGMPVTIALD
jgi:hypothetical protein